MVMNARVRGGRAHATLDDVELGTHSSPWKGSEVLLAKGSYSTDQGPERGGNLRSHSRGFQHSRGRGQGLLPQMTEPQSLRGGCHRVQCLHP